jgi:hypothetical protein
MHLFPTSNVLLLRIAVYTVVLLRTDVQQLIHNLADQKQFQNIIEMDLWLYCQITRSGLSLKKSEFPTRSLYGVYTWTLYSFRRMLLLLTRISNSSSIGTDIPQVLWWIGRLYVCCIPTAKVQIYSDYLRAEAGPEACHDKRIKKEQRPQKRLLSICLRNTALKHQQ